MDSYVGLTLYSYDGRSLSSPKIQVSRRSTEEKFCPGLARGFLLCVDSSPHRCFLPAIHSVCRQGMRGELLSTASVSLASDCCAMLDRADSKTGTFYLLFDENCYFSRTLLISFPVPLPFPCLQYAFSTFSKGDQWLSR